MISRWLSTLLNSAFPPRPTPRLRPRLLLEGLEVRDLLTSVFVDAPVWWPAANASGLWETRTLILNDPTDDLPDTLRVGFTASSVSVLDGMSFGVWVGGGGAPPVALPGPSLAPVPSSATPPNLPETPNAFGMMAPPSVPPTAPAAAPTGRVELFVRVLNGLRFDGAHFEGRTSDGTGTDTLKPTPPPESAKDKLLTAGSGTPRPTSTVTAFAPRAAPDAPQPPAAPTPAPAAPPTTAQPVTIPPTRGGAPVPSATPAAPVVVVPQASARVPDRAALVAASDGTLARQFAVEKNQAAFTELVRRYGPAVQATCTRVLGDADRARDAAQATFVALARRAHALDDRGSLAGWLHKVAKRMALRHRATAARHRRLERTAAELHEDADDPLMTFDIEDSLRVLREELARLPEKYRVPLTLCYLDGRTHAEVAQEVGLPRGSVAKRLGEAIARLRDGLSSRGLLS